MQPTLTFLQAVHNAPELPGALKADAGYTLHLLQADIASPNRVSETVSMLETLKRAPGACLDSYNQTLNLKSSFLILDS